MVNESNKDIVDTDTENTVSDSDPDFQEPSKQEKYQFNGSILDDKSDDMPFRFHHIHSGLWSVRQEYYKLTHKLKSELHLSEAQAQGAIISVANIFLAGKNLENGKYIRKERK